MKRVRKEDLSWSEEALALDRTLDGVLRPIMQEAMKEFSPEEVLAVVVTTAHEILLREVMDQRCKPKVG